MWGSRYVVRCGVVWWSSSPGRGTRSTQVAGPHPFSRTTRHRAYPHARLEPADEHHEHRQKEYSQPRSSGRLAHARMSMGACAGADASRSQSGGSPIA